MRGWHSGSGGIVGIGLDVAAERQGDLAGLPEAAPHEAPVEQVVVLERGDLRQRGELVAQVPASQLHPQDVDQLAAGLPGPHLRERREDDVRRARLRPDPVEVGVGWQARLTPS